MKKALVLACMAALICGSVAQALTYEPDGSVIVESRSGGKNYTGNFWQSGWATSSGSTTAPGTTTNIGSMYSGTTVYYGSGRVAIWSFTPETSGLYDLSLAWPSTAGHTDTVVTLFSGTGTNPTVNVIDEKRHDMYYKNTDKWNAYSATSYNLTAGTKYNVGVWGDHVAVSPANRVSMAAIKWTPVPEPVTMVLLAVGGLFLRRRRA